MYWDQKLNQFSVTQAKQKSKPAAPTHKQLSPELKPSRNQNQSVLISKRFAMHSMHICTVLQISLL